MEGVSVQSAGLCSSLCMQLTVYIVSFMFVWRTSFIYLVKFYDATNVHKLSTQNFNGRVGGSLSLPAVCELDIRY